MTDVVLYVSYNEDFGGSTVGRKVIDRGRFLDCLKQTIARGGTNFDGRRGTLVDLPPEAKDFVLAGRGPRFPQNPARFHRRRGRLYLKRNEAFPALGCFAIVYAADYFRQELEPHGGGPVPPEATHVLVGVGVIDATYGRKDLPWEFVADEEEEG